MLTMSDLTDEFNYKKQSTEKNDKYEEICGLYEETKLHRKRHIKNKILYETILEALKNKNCNLNKSTKEKVKRFLCLNPESNLDNSYSLSYVSEIKLSYEETESLKRVVENNIVEKHEEVSTKFRQLTNQNIQTLDLEPSTTLQPNIHQKILIDLKKQLNELQRHYMNNLKALMETLSEMLQLRADAIKKTAEKSTEYEITAEINQLKAKILDSKMRVEIFDETSNSLPAYEYFLKDIKEEELLLTNEIENLKLLKEKYETIRCKEYDSVLRSYLELKSSVDNKKRLYELKQKK